jgi:hypothetical protein
MRAQGLPLNTIVLGALAVLVLVLLAAAFVPSVGNMFRSLMFAGGTDPVSRCNLACINLDWKYADMDTASAAATGTYCGYDAGSGTCQTVIACTFRLTNGTSGTIPLDAANCAKATITWA